MFKNLTKKVPDSLSYILILVSLFLCGYFLAGLWTDGSIFNLFISESSPKREEVRLHLYDNEEVNISKVLVRVYYYVPQDKKDLIVDGWPRVFATSLSRVKEFFQLQFAYNTEFNYEIYPEVICSDYELSYLNDLLKQDYERELAEGHGDSLLIRAVVEEIKKRGGFSQKWDLSEKEVGGYFLVNLFVLASDITGFEGSDRQLLGLNDEKNNSLVMSFIFTDQQFKDFHESVICQEIGHALGIPEFYSLSGNEIGSYGVMGGGLTRRLRHNYLDSRIRKQMGSQ